MEESDYQLCIEKIDLLHSHLNAIEQSQCVLQAENKRLGEVIRLGDAELQKRQAQIQKLEEKITALQIDKSEAKGRVENAIAKLDQMMDHPQSHE